ncbi:MAG: phosphatidate cytidylyltransferase [Limnochordaceae bacterium]|nr:phosphatidate cytidylyltransferase [Limnochordaceae bacterium]
MKYRVVTVLIGLPIFLLPLLAGGWWWRALMLATGLGFGWELGQLVALRERRQVTPGDETGSALPLPPFDPRAGLQGAITVGSTVLSLLLYGLEGLAVFTLILVPLVGLQELFVRPTRPLTQGGAWVWGSLYLGGLWGVLALFRLQAGSFWALWPMLTVWGSDICAFLVGRRWGRHKLAPAVSPGKSWEGLVAGLVAAVGFGASWAVFMLGVSTGPAIGGSLLMGVAGVLGDLIESSMKREAGVKDAAAVLPGHGGLLDRMDSLLTAGALASVLYWIFHL